MGVILAICGNMLISVAMNIQVFIFDYAIFEYSLIRNRRGAVIVGEDGKSTNLNSRGMVINGVGKVSQKHSSLHTCQHIKSVSIILP